VRSIPFVAGLAVLSAFTNHISEQGTNLAQQPVESHVVPLNSPNWIWTRGLRKYLATPRRQARLCDSHSRRGGLHHHASQTSCR
jgi:hypothetical protein